MDLVQLQKVQQFLNFCNVNNKHIEMIFDNSKTKINKFTPLTKIQSSKFKYF